MKDSKVKRYKKILLAIDGSAHSKATVEKVAKSLFPPKTEMRIISVMDKAALTRSAGPMGALTEYYAEADHNALKAAENTTENAAKILHKKNPSLTITTIVMEGSPKSVILKEAETFGADLIIVGSHGYGAAERFMLGSVSHAVALHAKCSVEIVRT